MHKCDYCMAELERLMFCNHSHQVMYHKRGKRAIDETSTKQPTTIDETSTIAIGNCIHCRMPDYFCKRRKRDHTFTPYQG